MTPLWRGRRPSQGRAARLPPPTARPSGAPVNGYDVLAKVAALPVYTWRYDTEPEHVRHLGPMAQEWKAAFGLGDSDTTIPVVDAFGVALVALQALQRRVEDLEAELARHAGRHAALRVPPSP
uniref:Tail fiber domain-containing protein n=1 Tax=Streptomyces sp. NBC_00003 TaxID=2903608 RepID=A0AAU2UXE3_9ACTN